MWRGVWRPCLARGSCIGMSRRRACSSVPPAAPVLLPRAHAAHDLARDRRARGTVPAVAAAGLRGIAVEAGGAMVLDQNELVATADAAGLFIICVKVAP